MSETRFVSGKVAKVGDTKGGLPQVALKVKDGYRVVVLQIGARKPKVGDDFKRGNFKEGESIGGCKTYYEQPLEMKTDTHLVPGEHKCSDDFCEKAPTVLDKEVEVPLTIAIRVKFICAAAIATQGKSDHFDDCYDKMVSKLNETNK